jgi:hypothetical protein
MRPIGTIAGTIAAGVALVSGAAVAQAQTAVTRQITSEPVETVITQGPNGTAVTRRILTPEPGVATFAAPPPAYPPGTVETIESQDVEPAAPAPAPRRVTKATRPTTTPSHTVGQAPERSRTEATRRVSERPVRTVTRTVVVPPAPDQALVLTPSQRQIIYRGIVQREYYPAPVPAAPPVVQTDAYVPPPVAGYRTIYPADDTYRDYAYDPYHDQYRDPYHPVYRWDGVPLVVGARIPASLPLYAVPEPLALRLPSARPYSYAVVDNRLYLVDPLTSVIVAEVMP